MDTPLNTIPKLVEELRRGFDADLTRPLAWRREQLQALAHLLQEHQDAILSAMHADLGKPPLEAFVSEVQFVQTDIAHTLSRLERWTRPEKVRVGLVLRPGRAEIVRQPLGVVLVVGPWNYPWQLVLSPAVAAIAAGDAVVLKPSELAPACSDLLAELLPRYLDSRAVRVVTGGVPQSQALLQERWDHIFFTGGERVGRIVMEAAARHLTPVTLELGGKSPAIVHRSASLEVSARRLLWGRFFNAGQTCVAPDYALVDAPVYERFLELAPRILEEFYGEDPSATADYGRIVSEAHHARLVSYLDQGRVVVGGAHDATQRYLAPTILAEVDPASPVMQEEIFGPILPVLRVDDLEQAMGFVRSRPSPLALYVFAEDKAAADRVLARTTSGGASVNDAIVHLTVPELPFGGVGASGIGAYHGRHGFEAFSHQRSVLRRTTKLDPSFRYPPYAQSSLKWLERLM